MRRHELKILPKWYENVESSKKNFEIRRNDRDFKIGDTLILQEYKEGSYTGRQITRKIQYIYQGNGDYGLSEGYCILGLEQEPCEDAISREDALEALNTINGTAELDKAFEVIENLQSVTPQPQTGHWIEHEWKGIVNIECSKCSYWFLKSHLLPNSYCPNCGCRMIPPQEERNKE